MKLYINTSDFKEVVFRLLEGRKIIAEHISEIGMQEGYKIVPMLQQFLKKEKAEDKINQIQLYAGSGSYTGLRIGHAIAQGLSLAWGVPVKNVKK